MASPFEQLIRRARRKARRRQERQRAAQPPQERPQRGSPPGRRGRVPPAGRPGAPEPMPVSEREPGIDYIPSSSPEPAARTELVTTRPAAIQTASFGVPGRIPWVPLLILAGLIFGPAVARALGLSR